MKECGIYIHIPFCKSKCFYCDFVSFVDKSDCMQDYLRAVTSELQSKSKLFNSRPITTIYFGGGTPSLLPPAHIKSILSTIKTHYNVQKDAEITLECNPNSVTMSHALEWKNSGINRISVGFQTHSDRLLKKIGRTHTKKNFLCAIRILQEVGFYNISADLMFGLPSQKQSDLKRSINLVKSLSLPHISVYSLILEEGTPLFKSVENKEIKLPKEEKVIDMATFVNHYLEKLGYDRYEISNYCKDGLKSRHNYNCWSMVDYLGVGSAAHSFYNNTRFSNFSELDKYIESQTGKSEYEKIDVLTAEEMREEYIMLGLRRTEGISISDLNARFNADFLKEKEKEIAKLVNLGLIEISDDQLKATKIGCNLLNKIILDLS